MSVEEKVEDQRPTNIQIICRLISINQPFRVVQFMHNNHYTYPTDMIEMKDDNGNDLLFVAIEKEALDSIKTLLAFRANPNRINSTGYSSFAHAVIHKNPKILELFLCDTVDINTESISSTGETLEELLVRVNDPNITEMIHEYLKRKEQDQSITHV